MRVLVIGATGHIGAVVCRELEQRHEVLAASRTSAIAVDLTDPDTIAAAYETATADGPLDAVVISVGSVPFKPLASLDRDDYLAACTGKALAQIEVVRQGIGHLADGGSFTLTSGIVGRAVIATGAAAAVANGAIDYFVPAAAAELPRGLRINAVSPNVLQDAPGYHSAFPGFVPVSSERVAAAYVRSIEGIETGLVLTAD